MQVRLDRLKLPPRIYFQVGLQRDGPDQYHVSVEGREDLAILLQARREKFQVLLALGRVVNQFLQFGHEGAVAKEVIPQQFQGRFHHQGPQPHILRGIFQASPKCLHRRGTVAVLEQQFAFAGQRPGVVWVLG